MNPNSEEAVRVRALAAGIASLPSSPDCLAGRLESAGRHLVTAIRHGAFGSSDFEQMLTMMYSRLNHPTANGWISAWTEVCWWRRGQPKGGYDFVEGFDEDCRMISKALDCMADDVPVDAPGATT